MTGRLFPFRFVACVDVDGSCCCCRRFACKCKWRDPVDSHFVALYAIHGKYWQVSFAMIWVLVARHHIVFARSPSISISSLAFGGSCPLRAVVTFAIVVVVVQFLFAEPKIQMGKFTMKKKEMRRKYVLTELNYGCRQLLAALFLRTKNFRRASSPSSLFIFIFRASFYSNLVK